MPSDDEPSARPVPGSAPPVAHHEQQQLQSQEKRPTPEELISIAASNLASQPLYNSNPEVWGVLTAINNNARKRRQLEGPLSLDDFRSLQRSNAELRKQLECRVLTIEMLCNDKQAALERYEKEIKELNILTTQFYISQIEDLKKSLEDKKQELEAANKIAAEQKNVIIDLDERLNVSSQSFAEANEIINNQKVAISELKAQLNDERDQRRQEREKVTVDLKEAVQKVLLEAIHELMQYSEAASKRENEQPELISKHQESVKELSFVVETLRTRLEEHRQKLVTSDNRIRQLEAEISEEKKTSADRMKKIEGLEDKLKRLTEDLQSQKSAREEAWAKVSNLELQLNASKQKRGRGRPPGSGRKHQVATFGGSMAGMGFTPHVITIAVGEDITNLSKHARSRSVIMEYGGLSLVLDVLKTGLKVEAKQHAAAVLFYLSSVDEYRQMIGETPDAIPGLIDMVRDGNKRGKKNALIAIFGLLMYQDNRWRVLKAGLVPLLLDLLKTPDSDNLSLDCLPVLSILSETPDGAYSILRRGGLRLCTQVLVSSSSNTAAEFCVSTLINLCLNGGRDMVAILANDQSLIKCLYSILADGTTRASRKASSLLPTLHEFREVNSSSGPRPGPALATTTSTMPGEHYYVRAW